GVGAEAHQALALLRAGRLLRGASGGRVETYHDRVRETVAGRLPPEALAAHHCALGEALEAAGGYDPEVVAAHLHGAGEHARAGAYYARAAAQAAEALAFDRAVKLYALALALQPLEGEERRQLRGALADALAGAGRGAEAAAEYLAA